MNPLIVYFSKFGNTQLVAKAIGEVIGLRDPVRVINSDQLEASDLENAHLVIMGTPTHKMNLPEAVRHIFERLPKRILRGKYVAAFDTSYKMSPILARFTAAKELDRKLRKLGGKRVIKPETFTVKGKEGPLHDGELEQAREWGVKILNRVDRRIPA